MPPTFPALDPEEGFPLSGFEPEEDCEGVEPELGAVPEVPPLGVVDDVAGGSRFVGGGDPPVAVGGASEYWVPLESA